MNEIKEQIKTRIDWIDIAKGIVIILTIMGHTLKDMPRAVIFSFHMPFFFIMSMYTYKCSESISEFKRKSIKSSKHLLLPAFIVMIIGSIIQLFQNRMLIFEKTYWINMLYKIIFASGIETNFNGIPIECMGMSWFFVVLLCSRMIFDYTQLKIDDNQIGIVSVLYSLCGICLGCTQWLVFSLDIALSIQGFLLAAHYFKKIDFSIFNKKIFFSSAIIWFIVILLCYPNKDNWSYLELSVRRYSIFPISYLGAIAGTLFWIEFAILLSKIIDTRIISYIGKNSMYLLCVHALDYNWKFLFASNNIYLEGIKRVLVNLVITMIVIVIIDILGLCRIRKFKG